MRARALAAALPFYLVGIGPLVFGSAGTVVADTIDFSGVPLGFATEPGQFLDASGFRFTLEEPRSFTGFIEYGFSRALGGLFNANDAAFTMKAVDDSLFDLATFDFARRENDTANSRSAKEINIIGTLGGGGTVSFVSPGPLDAFTTASLPSTFVGLSSVAPVWAMTCPPVKASMALNSSRDRYP